MKIITLLFLIIGTFSCSAQKDTRSLITGKWELIVEENHLSENEAEISLSGSVTKTETDDWKYETIFLFKSDSLHINRNGTVYKTTYKLKDSTLILDGRNFKIFNIDEKELILEENGLTDKRYIYRKKTD